MVLLIINKMPMIRKGLITTNDHGLPVNDPKKYAMAIKARIKMVPPIISKFQATTNVIINSNAGILCMKKHNSLFLIGSFPSKQSAENITIKAIAVRARIRAIHFKVL